MNERGASRAVVAISAVMDALRVRDPEAGAAWYADDVTFEDRRPGLQWSSTGSGAMVELMRTVCDLAPDRIEMTTVAERGDGHALVRQSFSDSESSFVVESLVVIGVDSDGRIATYIAFSPDAEHDAVELLDELHGGAQT